MALGKKDRLYEWYRNKVTTASYLMHYRRQLQTLESQTAEMQTICSSNGHKFVRGVSAVLSTENGHKCQVCGASW